MQVQDIWAVVEVKLFSGQMRMADAVETGAAIITIVVRFER